MKSWRLFRTAIAATTVLFAFIFIAHGQDRPPIPISPSASHPNPDEKMLFVAANRERGALGLQALRWDDALAAAARRHAERMEREPELSHQYPGEPPLAQRAAQAGARFAVIAENVAVGPTAAEIHDGWMHSPGHRKNILDPELTAVGIVAIRGSGGLFAVQDFSRQVASLTLGQQEEQVVSLLRKAGVPGAVAGEDARKTCGMRHGYAGDRVRYVLRFDVSDLSVLPEELKKKIRVGAYRSAEVGACRDSHTDGFTVFRIAVLFR